MSVQQSVEGEKQVSNPELLSFFIVDAVVLAVLFVYVGLPIVDLSVFSETIVMVVQVGLIGSSVLITGLLVLSCVLYFWEVDGVRFSRNKLLLNLIICLSFLVVGNSVTSFSIASLI